MIGPALESKLTEFVSSVLVIIGMISKATYSVLVQYIEHVGCPLYQMFLMSSIMWLVSILFYWLILYLCEYYHYTHHILNSSNTNMNVNINIDIDSASNRNSNNSVSYCTGLCHDLSYSSIKQLSCRALFILFLRGLTGSIAGLFFILSLVYLNTGDAVLIQTVIITIGNVLFGMYFFNETKSKWIFFSMIICIFGLILVCQPSFIFKSDSSSSVSIIGFIFVSMSAICRLGPGILSKYAKRLKINWFQLSIVAAIMATIVSTIVVIIEYAQNDGHAHGKKRNVIWMWDNYNADYIALSFVCGCLLGLFVMTYTIAFQFGIVSKLGILLNTDVIFAYILQILILNIIENGITYTGVVIVLTVCAFVFVIQWKESKKKNTKVEYNYQGDRESSISSSQDDCKQEEEAS